jgi:glycerol-3-phosphate acyltransferase PlsY
VELLRYLLTALLAYLLGSIPTGYLVARAKGIDIRSVGSGNIGATNVMRILGKPAGILVLIADGLKGWVACGLLPDYVLPFFEGRPGPEGEFRQALAIVCGVAAVLGHNYPCWLKFKGGKGIATSAGVLAALVPWALVIILSLWIVFCLLTRYVSIGSLVASFTLPFASWFTTHSTVLTVVTGAMGALAIYKHRANIQRLLNGTESQVSFGKREDRK